MLAWTSTTSFAVTRLPPTLEPLAVHIAISMHSRLQGLRTHSRTPSASLARRRSCITLETKALGGDWTCRSERVGAEPQLTGRAYSGRSVRRVDVARPDNGEATMVETGDSDRWSRSHTTITVASVVAQRQALVGEDELGGTPVV